MVNTQFIISGSSYEFDLNSNDKLQKTNIKLTEPEERFSFGITTTSDNTVFQIPVRGYGFDGQQNISYDWLIDYGDNIPLVNKYGTSSTNGVIDGHIYDTAGPYTITVYPATSTPAYGWARAFSCGDSPAPNTTPYITNGGKFTWKSLAENENSVGDYFNVSKYSNCSVLVDPEDTSGWNISGAQGVYFNAAKYGSCSILTDPEDTSGWTISGIQGDFFNGTKYINCRNLTRSEDTSGWSISDNQGVYFNYGKYMLCQDLNTSEDTSNWSISGSQGENFNCFKYYECIFEYPEDTSGWSISGIQGDYFDQNKYIECENLINPDDTSKWSISGEQGNYFNAGKYSSCKVLTKPEDTSAWTISGEQGSNFNDSKYSECHVLSKSEDTSGWSISGSQGDYFNYLKYLDCNYVSSLEDWSLFGDLTSSALSANAYLCFKMYSLLTPKTNLIDDTTEIRNHFPDPITPPYIIGTFCNQEGLTDYANLDPKWTAYIIN